MTGFGSLDPAVAVKIKRRVRNDAAPPEYWLASIVRSRALLDKEASSLVEDVASTCTECHIGGVIKRVTGVVVQAGSWAGEDVFFARGLPGTILASDRFKRLCDEATVLNCSLVPAEEYGFDFYPEEGKGPTSWCRQ